METREREAEGNNGQTPDKRLDKLRGRENEQGDQQFDDNLNENPSEADRSGRLRDRKGKLLFGLGVSKRYCSKRESYFVFLDKVATFINLLGASAVMADISKIAEGYHLALIGSGTVLIISLLSLIFQWSENARHYAHKKRGYISLIERMQRLGRAMTQEEVNDLRADFTLMESDESEPKDVLLSICNNEECTFRGIPESKVKIYPWQRWCASVISLPPTTWE